MGAHFAMQQAMEAKPPAPALKAQVPIIHI
jgi:hypothetical protein